MSGPIGAPCTTSRYMPYRTPWGLTVTINRVLLPRFRAACNEAHSHPWKPLRIDSYVCRPIRGSSSYSRHAYAAAFDFFDRPYPQPVDVWGPTNAPPASFAGIFKRYGFSWGGDWRSRKDYPHIEWATSTVPPYQGRSWFDMASKADLREVVREVLQNQLTRSTPTRSAVREIVREVVQNQVPKIVEEETTKQRKILAVGTTQRGYIPDNVNLRKTQMAAEKASER